MLGDQALSSTLEKRVLVFIFYFNIYSQGCRLKQNVHKSVPYFLKRHCFTGAQSSPYGACYLAFQRAVGNCCFTQVEFKMLLMYLKMLFSQVESLSMTVPHKNVITIQQMVRQQESILHGERE